MNNSIYQTAPLIKQSFFQKLFRQQPLENAIIEINNILAKKPISLIKNEEINSITEKYKINLLKTFPKNIEEFYAAFLNHCLKDKVLSEEELNDLKHLKELLNLNDRDVEKIHTQLAGTIFKANVQEAINDGRIDQKERQFLERLQSELKLPDEIANKISGEVRGKFINEYLNNAISDERLSPAEEEEFLAISKSLMVDTKMEEHVKSKLDKYRLYWLIENAELPFQDVNINLQKNEVCYFTTQVEWFEQRTVTKRINYGGPVARVKIMKGVYYRVGSVSAQRVTNEEWKAIDNGQIYLTNKRMIFIGDKKNTNIRLEKILAFTPYSNGIEIDKDAGRSPFLKFTENVDIFGLLLSRLLREI